MLYFLATPKGFYREAPVNPNKFWVVTDNIRKAHPFTSFADADAQGKALPIDYYCILCAAKE